ncbi:hypothetical protein PWT90_05393 [Aphanocladium album]|nr:hypothetical protein PWT90_05393 [Aphanocladium album]
MVSSSSVASVANLLAMLPVAMAAFNPGSNKNIAVYWGQNSYNQGSGPLAQQRLGTYCQNTDLSIIPLAFMNGITPAITNFANAGDNCTAFPDNGNVLSCPQIEEDIKSCQSKYGKTISLSLGGATYSQGGWSSSSAAESAAQMVWDMFGPVQSGKNVDRPFGSAVVDGFDFDFESSANNLPAFGAKLRSLMDSAGGKKYYLSAAPQCVFPDAAVGAALDAVAFDFVMIQFYNNWCGVSNFQEGASSQNAFNFDVWDKWAKGSKNPNVKLLLGIPAAPGAGGGYTSGSKLKAAINYSQKYSSFGGVMLWDMSQLYSNNGFLGEVLSDISGGPATTQPPSTTTQPPGTTTQPPGTTTTCTSTTTPASTSTPPPTSGGLDQYAQCGGQGYSGPTVCKAPYTCVKQNTLPSRLTSATSSHLHLAQATTLLQLLPFIALRSVAFTFCDPDPRVHSSPGSLTRAAYYQLAKTALLRRFEASYIMAPSFSTSSGILETHNPVRIFGQKPEPSPGLSLASRSLQHPNHTQQVTLGVIAAYVVVIAILWNVPYIKNILWPFKMLVIAFHEFGHAITAVFTGGRVKSISLDPNEGGVTKMVGGISAITLPAGYLGSSIIGALLTFCGFNIVASKIASIVLGVCFLLTLWWGKRDWLTVLTVLLAVALLVACWFIKHAEALRFVVLFIGVMSSLYSVWDICDDLILRKVNSSDASVFAKRYGGSSQCWGIIWSIISVLIMAVGIVAGLAAFSQSFAQQQEDSKHFIPT